MAARLWRTRAKVAPPILEWQVGESENGEVWQPLPSHATAVPATVMQWKRSLAQWFELGVVLLILLVASGWKWYATWLRLHETTSVLTSVVRDGPWTKTADVELLEVTDFGALVRVFIQPLTEEESYRQTRVYRQTATGWEFSEPKAALWGKRLTLKTRYFTLIYREADAEAVEEVAQKLDSLYQRFFGSFFSEDPASRSYTIEVDPEAQPEAQSRNRLVVTSPGTYVVPARISEGDILLQSIALALLNDLAGEALQRYSHPPYTNSFAGTFYLQQWTDALRLWQLAELDISPELWQRMTSNNYDSFVLTYSPEICVLSLAKLMHAAAKSGVRANPVSKIACPGSWLYSYTTRLKLAQTVTFFPIEVTPELKGVNQPVGKSPHVAAPVVLATVLGYASATYGQEFLPKLLANFGSYRSWESLLPATLGVSTASFVQGWRAYLSEHYALADSPPRTSR